MDIQENNYNYDPALQNDLILESIFSHLSTLSDFCSIRLVCKKWNHIGNKALKQVSLEFRLDHKTCHEKWDQISKFIAHHQLPHILVLSLTKYSWHHSATPTFSGKAKDVEVALNKFIWENENILQQTTDLKMMMMMTVSFLVELKLEFVCNSESDAILLYSILTPCTHLKRLWLEFVRYDWTKHGICHFQPDDNDSCILPQLHTLALVFRLATINHCSLLQPRHFFLVHLLTRPIFQKLSFLDLDPYQYVHRNRSNASIVLEALSSITKLQTVNERLLPQLTGLKLNIWWEDVLDLNTILPQFQHLYHLYLHIASEPDQNQDIPVSLQECLQNLGILFQKLSSHDQIQTLDLEWDLLEIDDDIDEHQDRFVELSPLRNLTHLSLSCGVCSNKVDQQKWTLEQMDRFKVKEILSSRDKFSSLFPSLTHLTLSFFNDDNDDGSKWDYIFSPSQHDDDEDDDEIIPQLKYLTISLVIVGTCCKKSIQIDRILTKFPNLVRLCHLVMDPTIKDKRIVMGCEHLKNYEGEWLVSKWILDLQFVQDRSYNRMLHINLMRPELLFNNPEKQHGFWQGLSYFNVSENYTTTNTDLVELWWRNNIRDRWRSLKRIWANFPFTKYYVLAIIFVLLWLLVLCMGIIFD